MFPNDVTTDGSAVYVSDMMGSSIYKLSGGSVEKWLDRREARHARTGCLVDGNTLYVGSMGTGMKPDFTFDTKGGLQAVDLGTKAITEVAMDAAYTDGVAKLGDQVIFDDNPAGTVLELRRRQGHPGRHPGAGHRRSLGRRRHDLCAADPDGRAGGAEGGIGGHFGGPAPSSPGPPPSTGSGRGPSPEPSTPSPLRGEGSAARSVAT